MRSSASALAGILLLAAPIGSAASDGVPMKPGKWRVRTISVVPMAPNEQVQEGVSCVVEESFGPQDLMPVSHVSTCRVSDVVVDGNQMTWKIRCTNPHGGSTGVGRFQSQGDRAEGTIDLEMAAAGPALNLQVRWEGERIGECDAPDGTAE